MPLLEIEDRIVRAVEAVGPSVAGVDSLRVGRARGYGPFARPAQATALVLQRDGYLITNQHVVEGAARLEVHLSDGRALPAELVGGDEATDVALLRVDATDLPAATLGNSNELRVGQIVVAVGHALGLPGGPTASLGVVSALGRPLPGTDFIFEGLVQTDAAINPGNSGGPLVDLSGAVVGINAAMVPFAQGVGFAIPIHAVQRIADDLRTHGRVVRPWIGVMVAELRPETARQYGLEPRSGLLVAEVVRRSPSHRAGLKAGDVIERVGPIPTHDVRELLEALSRFPVGSDVPIDFRRRGSVQTVTVPSQEMPEPAASE